MKAPKPSSLHCLLLCLLAGGLWMPALAQQPGQGIYMQRCFWCHGENGDGKGSAAEGMIPSPRNFVQADYKIRSTGYGRLPTDEDLFKVISKGIPGTSMPGWEGVLSEEERRQLVSYLKSFSPRFGSEERQPIAIPSEDGSVERGEEVYRSARCFMCHGESGRGDGGITAALNYQWGMPYRARDLTRGWTFKGGHQPAEIYLRITGGLNGTPMGPYQDLLSDQERWDLAHYVASLDSEPQETSDSFVVPASFIQGAIPDDAEAAEWQSAPTILVPLAGQVTLDPPSRWWAPTAGSANVRALWNGTSVGFLLEWHDPTGPGSTAADSASIQFAAHPDSKPYFLGGGRDDPVRIWQWNAQGGLEELSAAGIESVQSHPAGLEANSFWRQGRWQLIVKGPLQGEPQFEAGRFVPTLFSMRDGANSEIGSTSAISTWLYATLERPSSLRPWLWGLAWLLGAVIAELLILARLKAKP